MGASTRRPGNLIKTKLTLTVELVYDVERGTCELTSAINTQLPKLKCHRMPIRIDHDRFLIETDDSGAQLGLVNSNTRFPKD